MQSTVLITTAVATALKNFPLQKLETSMKWSVRWVRS
nr:unnamed protein product [Callosobruchus analis]